ncbi:2OG-Fe(II) oxygenase [Chitinophagaceae bacterium MMS25-I14]
MTAQVLAKIIAERLENNQTILKDYWEHSSPVRHFFIDDLLPEQWANAIYHALPHPDQLMLRDTEKEKKRVGIKLEDYDEMMTAILYAFQDEAVIRAISNITGLQDLEPDESLYGSGISMMMKGDFLKPHLDNSHDGDGRKYRIINTLYYITPGWPKEVGGNLELWNKSMKQKVEIHSRFNRLAVMETHTASIHSVNEVTYEGIRACISNYYFSAVPLNQKPYVHKTTFYARPEDSVTKKLFFRAEGMAKNFLSRFFNNKATQTKHRR